MADEHNPSVSNRSPLQAGVSDPKVGVHTITEFLFCPRAGLVAYESPQDDLNAQLRPVRLGYLPRYDLEEIKTAIGKTVVVLAIGGTVGVLAILLSVIMSLGERPMMIVVSWLLLVALVVFAVAGLARLAILVWRYEAAVGAVAEEPVFHSAREVPIGWWNLKAAGWESRNYPDGPFVEEWKIRGHPWRVLIQGDRRVPVFLWQSETRKLHKQHFARMAGYCQLLQHNSGCASPYGVILFAGTDQGLALPNTKVAQQAFIDGVRGIRKMLNSLSSTSEPPAPINRSLCVSCPCGRPRLYKVSQTAGDGPEPYMVPGSDGKSYHSPCGDRFKWIPFHHKAYAYGLVTEDFSKAKA